MSEESHKPVMLGEVLEYMNPRDGAVYVDGTFGAGGYTKALLDAADCTVISIDRDETVLPRAQELKNQYAERFVFLQGCFGDVAELLSSAGYMRVDGFVVDLGVSSMQLDQAERGFSFRFDGPLDMRMGRSGGETAADLVNNMGEEDLANVIYKYGEERLSRRIAKAIVTRRAEESFETTAQLADIVRSVVRKSPKDKSDPATRTFQALRIAVNDELGELERALAAAPQILAPDGRMVVVTFHSLEDRIAKNYARDVCGSRARANKYAPVIAGDVAEKAGFIDLTRKAVLPGDVETKVNPRARSAKLRAIQYVGAT